MPSFSRKILIAVKYTLIIMQLIQLIHGVILFFHWTSDALSGNMLPGHFNPWYGTLLSTLAVLLSLFGLPSAYRESVPHLWAYSAGSALAIGLYLCIHLWWTDEEASLYNSSVWMSDATRMILAWMLILTIRDQEDDWY